MRTRRQQGAATLVVVMVLFFIISMVAAYTGRNMIFEQRTGTNLYRATQSLEAAEAGMEWALMLLNTGRIDDQCIASADPSDPTFRDRYVAANVTTGVLAARTQSGGGALTPTCVFDRSVNRWDCSCPEDGSPSLAVPAGDETAPAFRVRFRALNVAPPARPGLLRIDVVGCTRLDDDCLSLTGAGVVNEGRTVLGSVAMVSGRAMVTPRAALTARGNVATSTLTVSNVRVTDGGVTVHASGTIDSGLSLTTISGNALGGSTIANDSALELPALAPFSASQRVFASIFFLTPERWVQQPAVLTVTCGVSGCSAAEIRTAIAANPGRPLWIVGDVSVDSTGDIGTATEPVLLVINGNLSFSASGVSIHGMLVIRPADPVSGWVTAGSGSINGAVYVDGAVTGSGNLAINYNGDVLTALRATVGNFARVPGSWRDWTMP